MLPLSGSAAAPEGSGSPALRLQLDWVFNAQFAGVLLARHAGLYTDRGLAVEILPWQSGMAVTERVARDPYTVGCAEQNLVLAAQAEGQPIVALAAMFQDSPLALMALPNSGVNVLGDLSGKPVGVHVDGAQVLELVIDAHFEAAPSPAVQRIPREAKFERLLAGEFAAVQCYGVDEPIEFLAQTGIEPRVLSLSDYGHDAYAQVLFAHRELLLRQSTAVLELLQVIFNGWRLAATDPAATADLLVEEFIDPAGHYHDVASQVASLERVLVNVQGSSGVPLGTIDPVRWLRTAEQFAARGIIPAVPPLGASLAVGFWPPAPTVSEPEPAADV
ncbi:MAG: ABC transporter substrate-binding protein [Pseudomonadota bacterium]